MNALLPETDERDDLVCDLAATRRVDSFIQHVVPPPSTHSAKVNEAYEEFFRLYEAGHLVDPDEYCARFPDMKASLRRLIEIDLRCQTNPELIKELAKAQAKAAPRNACYPDMPRARRATGYPSVAGRLVAHNGHTPEPGGQFFGFDLLEELGKGAFAKVFLARERAVGNRLVALKVTGHNDHEADTLGQLAHPNVMPVFSTMFDERTQFTAVCMPYLGRATLLDVLDKTPADKPRPRDAGLILDIAKDTRCPAAGLPAPARALRNGSFVEGIVYLGTRMADALAYVHERKILHRDLKPSNVLLNPHGEPVLLDFNLALNPGISVYRNGGTLQYMSPEMLASLPHKQAVVPNDPRADLFSLGTMLYELLAGTLPFGPTPIGSTKGSLPVVCGNLLTHQRGGTRSLRKLNPNVDAALEAIIMRCIALDPAKRPSTAHELAELLRRYQAPLCRAARWVVRHSWAAATVAGLALTGTGVGAYEIATMPSAAVRNEQSAEANYREGRFADAAQQFSASLAADPNQPDVVFKRGRTYQQMHEWLAAYRDYEAALESATQESRGPILACMGFCMSKDKDHRKAISYYNQAAEANFATAEVFSNMAFSLLLQDDSAEAEQSASKAIALAPGLLSAHYNHARAIICSAEHGRKTDLAAGVDEMRYIFMHGPGTRDQYYWAAKLCFMALKERSFDFKNPNTEYNPIYESGLEYTRKALERGYSRDVLLANPYEPLLDWVKKLPHVKADSTAPVQPFDPLADPLRGLLN